MTQAEAEKLAMNLLRHWQRRKTRPVLTAPERGICENWFLVLPRGVVDTLLAAGTWKISTITVPSANGRKLLKTRTFHPVA